MLKRSPNIFYKLKQLNYNRQILLRGLRDGNHLFIVITAKPFHFPVVRSYIRDSFAEIVRNPVILKRNLIAGVATGAIAHGALVAEKLGLPFIYVRSEAKEHGLGNQIEGYFEPGQKVVVIEDLISTGGSSLGAVKALREAGCDLLGMAAIFTYEFKKAADGFAAAKCELHTLSNYSTLISAAVGSGYITEQDVETLKQWRIDPSAWGLNRQRYA